MLPVMDAMILFGLIPYASGDVFVTVFFCRQSISCYPFVFLASYTGREISAVAPVRYTASVFSLFCNPVFRVRRITAKKFGECPVSNGLDLSSAI